MTLSALAADVF